ncbi:MAG TPA: class II glutamine amidotransferase [Burkholderiales bacterium]|nr:class II glutamine amidotransferase [Burkholderiales bacterium]
MCRVVAYLGEPVFLDHLLFAPDNSLVRQTYAPRRLRMVNLAGFGLAAWDPYSHDVDTPFVYHTDAVPVFDTNLKSLSQKLRVTSVLAHVRGVEYGQGTPVGLQFLHPFLYEGMHVALAHNGNLARFGEMRPLLQPRLKPEISRLVKTNLDSEWIYALFLSQLDDPSANHSGAELADALIAALENLAEVRRECGIATTSGVNLFVANRHAIVGARYVFDFGCDQEGGPAKAPHQLDYLSLWYSIGRQYTRHEGEWKTIGGRRDASVVLLASEPLTQDESTWLEVPEYSLVSFDIGGGRPNIQSRFISV